MCGIAGIVSADPSVREAITGMVEAIRHRGPDEMCVQRLGDAVLGSARLAIQDLAGGRQPMVSEDGALAVAFNGEIYNHLRLRQRLEREDRRFRTHCDTETVLHLYQCYGERFVDHLEGMFAVAIWDAPARKLVLARDHLGQKPLFYVRAGGVFAFASEAKALLFSGLASPRLNVEALYHYVSLRFLPDDLTLFREIAKLPAAHLLVFEDGDLHVRRYWSLQPERRRWKDKAEIVDAIDDRLRSAVREHLLSDVPVGAFLSGGIDSSLVTAMMVEEASGTPATFALGVREQGFDELPFARAVARQQGTHHYEEVVEADLVRLLPEITWHLEEPADPFAVGVYLVSRLAAQQVKVVLSGDGGDELFAGYDRYLGHYLAEIYRLVPTPIRKHLLGRAIAALPDSFGYKSAAQRLLWIHRMAQFEGGRRYAESMSFLRFSSEAKWEMFTASARTELEEIDSGEKILTHFDADSLEDAVDRMLFTDLMTRIPEHLLPIVDRMSMAHGLEVRPPFLEHRVVDFCMSIPGRRKLRRAQLKYLLRRVAERYLEPEIVTRPKQGFGFPLARWIQGDLKHLLDTVVEESRLVEAGVFERSFLKGLLQEHLSGTQDHNYRLWLLLALEVWHRLFVDGETRQEVAGWLERGVAPSGE